MLRGSSRHDGIPNKQSAKDPDRDRQREQQRKERAQMLPDDKEIHAGTHDLFNAPVKVKPSIEDTTSLQIRNSLGNFEPIRRLMEYPGTSQPPQAQIQQTFLTGPAAAAAVAADRGYHSVTSASSALAPHRNTNHNIHDPPAPLPPSYRPPPSSSNSFPPTLPPESNSTKSLSTTHRQKNNEKNTTNNGVLPAYVVRLRPN